MLLHEPEQGKKGFCLADIPYDNRDVIEMRDHGACLGRQQQDRSKSTRQLQAVLQQRRRVAGT